MTSAINQPFPRLVWSSNRRLNRMSFKTIRVVTSLALDKQDSSLAKNARSHRPEAVSPRSGESDMKL